MTQHQGAVDRVRVEKHKWPDQLSSRWDAECIGEDNFGMWLLSRAGEPHTDAAGSAVFRPEGDAVQLLPNGQWWTAWWWSHDGWITVDIATPPTRTSEGWRYIDLELDPTMRDDGRVELWDEQEFEELVSKGMPADVEREARAASAVILDRLRMREEPFGSWGWSKLKQPKS